MTEEEGRAAVLAEARTWIGTPYRHRGRVKGPNGCVDCAQLVWAVYHAVGLTPDMEAQEYPPDWYCHRDAERFMEVILGRARIVDYPKPGDIALFKVGRLFAHGGIVTEAGWPNIIHAYAYAKSVTESRADGGKLAGREVIFFSRW